MKLILSVVPRLHLFLLMVLLLGISGFFVAGATSPATYCNPLNLDYGWRSGGTHRHGADPVIVLFKNQYYLFSTWDVAGFRVSIDLIDWVSHEFTSGGQTADDLG